MRQAGRYLPEYRKVRAEAGDFLALCYTPKLAAEVTLQPWRRFGTDAVILFADILLLPDALGQRVAYVEGDGPRLQPLCDAAGVAGLRLEGFERRLAPVFETVAKVRAGVDAKTAVIGFAGAPWTVAAYMVEGGGSAQFAAPRLWAYRDPPAFQALIDLIAEATVRYLASQVRAGAEAVQLFDTWAGLLSASQFRQFCVLPTQKIVRALKAEFPSLPIIGFPKGANAVLDDYARETGVDAISLDVQVPAIVAATLAPSVALQGNLDPLAVVAGGERMKAETEEILRAIPAARHVFNLGHGFLPETPPEHVAALAEMLREWTPGG
jgi:uroporphyrinogen decarboxylase